MSFTSHNRSHDVTYRSLFVMRHTSFAMAAVVFLMLLRIQATLAHSQPPAVCTNAGNMAGDHWMPSDSTVSPLSLNQQTNGTIIGSAAPSTGASGVCPAATPFPVSGKMNTGGIFFISMTVDHPTPACQNATINAALTLPACDFAVETWGNADGSSGTGGVQRRPYIPIG